jgi:Arylsulfotransferase (ASST)
MPTHWARVIVLGAMAASLHACKASRPSAKIAEADAGTHSVFGGSSAIQVRARRNPAMVVSALVDVEAPGAERIVVSYGEDPARSSTTPELVTDASGRVTAVLLGLRPGAVTHIQVAAHAAGRVIESAPLDFRAELLPPDVAWPDVRILSDDGTARGFLLGAFSTPKGKVATVLDRSGRVVWYKPLAGDQVGVFDRLPNGRFILYNWPARVFEEIDLGGVVVRRWVPSPPASEDGADPHEFLPRPDNRALVIGWQVHAADSRSRFADGAADAERRDNTVVEIDASGASQLLWSSYPDVRVEELRPVPEAEIDPASFEVAHANAVDVSADGQLLAVTCRELEQVLGIESATGEVRWRLGGKRASLRILGDPLGGVSAVHDARLLPDHRLRIFDNGNSRKVRESRVVIYKIDEAAQTARLVWEYRHDPPIYTWVGGSARDLPEGRLLVNFSWKGTITEIDAERKVHWEIKVPGSGTYRMEWVPTLYP